MYCCANCLQAGLPTVPGLPACEHCEVAIVDPATLVDRHGLTFCCYNCAAAVPARAVQAA
jgi:hypothetical protein